jgi:hypothetical protein
MTLTVTRLASLLVMCSAFTPPCAAAEDAKEVCLQAYADAQSMRLDGALIEAREKLQQCARASCPKVLLRDCTEWLAEVEQNLSSVVFAVTDAQGRDIADAQVHTGERVLADGLTGKPVLLNPGIYVLTFEATGYVPARRRLVIRQSEKSRIVRVPLSPLPPPASVQTLDQYLTPAKPGFRLPVPAIALGASAVLGVASFAYFGLSGVSKREQAERCEEGCRSLIDAGKRDYLIADISLGVALAAAGSALLWTWLGQEAEAPPSAAKSGARALPLRVSAHF